MKRKNIVDLFVSLIVFLFLYTAISKLKEFHAFHESMNRQIVPNWSKPILVWAIPLSEILVSLCLLYETVMPALKGIFYRIPDRWLDPAIGFRLRMIGLIGSLILMTTFTAYVALAVFKAFQKVPCSCGGIIQTLGWKPHLVLNATFLLMTIAAIYLSRHPDKDNSKAASRLAQPLTS